MQGSGCGNWSVEVEGAVDGLRDGDTLSLVDLAVVADTPTNWDQYFLNTIQVLYATRFDRDVSSTV